MEYLIDARYKNIGFGINIHFLTTINVEDEEEATLFQSELLAGFNRMKWEEIHSSLLRIDHNEDLREQKYKELDNLAVNSKDTLIIEQFLLDDPDQTKSIAENLIKKLKESGESSSKAFCRKYSIPIGMRDSLTGRSITGEFSYLRIEHLIPTSK